MAGIVMSERQRYRPALKYRLVHIARWPMKILLKLAVPIFAIIGKYPPLMLTPDDPVSPFGCGTTPGAAAEPTMQAIYRRFGRYVGDVIWLGWRNSGFGIGYYLKPAWLKDPWVRYLELELVDERAADGTGTIWLHQPDGTWLWETTRKFGPVYLITGYRLRPIIDAYQEERGYVALGQKPIGRPVHHPNMDGRRIVSLRTARTL